MPPRPWQILAAIAAISAAAVGVAVYIALAPSQEVAPAVYVCNPDIGINKVLEAVFIQFAVMDAETQQGTGKSHTGPDAHARRNATPADSSPHPTAFFAGSSRGPGDG